MQLCTLLYAQLCSTCDTACHRHSWVIIIYLDEVLTASAAHFMDNQFILTPDLDPFTIP